MKDAYTERMKNLADLARNAAGRKGQSVEDLARFTLKAGLRGIARQETEASDDEDGDQRGYRIEAGVEHLLIEGMFRVIDDRRSDPDYLARLNDEDRRALEDPFGDIRAELEEQADRMRGLSQGWGEPSTPDAPEQ